MLLGVTLVVLQAFFSSVIPQVRGSDESLNADDGLHTIPTDGGVYDSLTVVQIVTPTTIDTKTRTYAYEVRWFMDVAPIDTDGLWLHAVESTPTNITWQAILQDPPSATNHSFTFSVVWHRFEELAESGSGLTVVSWTEYFSGIFAITHASIHYDFDDLLNWNVVSGTWSVVNGSLDGFSNAEGLIHTGDIIWNEYMLTTKVKIAADSPRAEAAFCVRLVDSENFYWAGLGCWGHRVSISRMVDHVPEELAFSGDSADIVKDVWYVLSIEVSDNAISLYVNDILELVVNDSTFASGVVGTRVWNAHVLVDYVTVSGFPSTEREIYYGFALHGALSGGGEITLSDLQKIKGWGFNCIQPYVWWRDFEPDPDRVGYYSDYQFEKLDALVSNAKKAGLYVCIAMRVSYGAPSGSEATWDKYSADYMNMDTGYVDEGSEKHWKTGGRQRYVNLLEKIVLRYPDDHVFYCPWQFPYHATSASNTDRTTWVTITFPLLLQTIRKHQPNKDVVFVPIHQNPSNYPSSPFADDNIVYGLGHAVPGYVSYGKRPWSGDKSEIDDYLEPVRQWREKYPDMVFMSVEYGGIARTSSGIDQSRFDCLEYACQKMQQYKAGWMYHCISKKNTWDTILRDKTNFIAEESLLEILLENRL